MAWPISVTARSRLACLTVLAATLQPGFFVPVFPSGRPCSSLFHSSTIAHTSSYLSSRRRSVVQFILPSVSPYPVAVISSNQSITSCAIGVPSRPTRDSFRDRLPRLVVCLSVWRHACLRLRLLICADSSARPFVSSPGALFAAAHSSPCIVSFSCTLVTVISDAVVYLADRSDTLCPGQDGRP
ncbi:hypothetical protein F5Y07DRAFT_290353 [Xylaria sp. FL0933]|nr:hypothetical protein F5Y07DRAFT_290353 [Xylaria sp. FL0933]